jgi:hypothetical protein
MLCMLYESSDQKLTLLVSAAFPQVKGKNPGGLPRRKPRLAGKETV